MLRINLGCGEFKLDGFINVDMEPKVQPDMILDFRKESLPWDDGSVEEVFICHCLEHVEFHYWEDLFKEVRRVLKPNGNFLLSYPEFSECATRFLQNDPIKRHFWRATLYGRQLYPSDYHVTPMHSPTIKEALEVVGFYRITYGPEDKIVSPYNTILIAKKDPSPMTREEAITRELALPAKSL